jgi:hypothetical protein
MPRPDIISTPLHHPHAFYSLVGLMGYKRPNFRPNAGAVELSWRSEEDRANRGALYRVSIL